mgnify:CR=1 FL=1
MITPTFTAIAPICNGSTAPALPATSTNGIAGTWNPSTISNTASGSYTFTPTNAASCNSSASVSVTVVPTSQYTETFNICSEELPYSWNGQSVPAGGAAAATYVTPSANGCDSTVTLNLNVTASSNPSISISVSPAGTIYSGVTTTFTATLTDGGSSPQISWRKNGIDIPGANAATWVAIAGTDFYHGDEISAYADNFNFCASAPVVFSNALMMYINPNSIKQVPNRPGFKMYPNPSQALINIESLLKGDHYRVYDALGRMLTEGETDGTKTLQIDLSSYAQGMYIIKFSNNSGQAWQQKINKL